MAWSYVKIVNRDSKLENYLIPTKVLYVLKSIGMHELEIVYTETNYPKTGPLPELNSTNCMPIENGKQMIYFISKASDVQVLMAKELAAEEEVPDNDIFTYIPVAAHYYLCNSDPRVLSIPKFSEVKESDYPDYIERAWEHTPMINKQSGLNNYIYPIQILLAHKRANDCDMWVVFREAIQEKQNYLENEPGRQEYLEKRDGDRYLYYLTIRVPKDPNDPLYYDSKTKYDKVRKVEKDEVEIHDYEGFQF